jgi:glycosyltransferase involved in cell wall biosynthesis
MKIAILAPPWFPIPPPMYGGIEQVVRDHVEGFTSLGHEVVLIAPGDSHTPAQLVPIVPRHITLNNTEEERVELHKRLGPIAYELALSEHPDLIHDHADYVHPRNVPVPVVRTLHGPAVDILIDRYVPMSEDGDHFVSISHRQKELYEARVRERGESINIVGVVHNPQDITTAVFREKKVGFAFFIGRSDWEKGPDIAIRVAKAASIPLIMSLRVAPYEQPYFDANVRPLLNEEVKLLDEISVEQKYDFMSRASVVLFTSQWEEPFGLVMTEAMACGTPVIAFSRGAAPEIILDGKTGFLCETEDQMVAAVSRVSQIDPAVCRHHVEEHFSPRVAAQHHIELYEQLLTGNTQR